MAIVSMDEFELGNSEASKNLIPMKGSTFVRLPPEAEAYLKESLTVFVDSAIERYKHRGTKEFQGYITLEDLKRVCKRERVTDGLLFSIGSYFANRGCHTVFAYENDTAVNVVFDVTQVQMTLKQTQKLRY